MQATIQCGFTLKSVREMIRTCRPIGEDFLRKYFLMKFVFALLEKTPMNSKKRDSLSYITITENPINAIKISNLKFE